MKTLITEHIVVGRVSPSAPTLSFNDAQRSMLCALLSFAFSLLASASFAQTWQTVDDFKYAPGQEAQADGLTVAPNGTLFACGDATDISGASHWLVMASDNAGSTWSAPLDNFIYPGADNVYNSGIVADSAGNLYVAGTAYNSSDNTNHWLVRRSADGGVTWSTVDDFVTFASGAFLAQPNGIAADSVGNIYVAGGAVYANSSDTTYWTVRKGSGGTNFSTVDSFPTHDYASQAQAVFAHPTSGIFVGGEAPVATNKFGNMSFGWVVRRSTNGGTNWATVDAFQLSSGYEATASAIGTDGSGNIYVAGRAAAPNKPNGSDYLHWVVRKSSNGGISWSTVDNYQFSSTGTSWPSAFTHDSKGNPYVAGWGAVNNGPAHWLVRQSTSGTGTWSTVDDFQYVTGGWAQPTAIVASASGNVFIAGLGAPSTGPSHWLIRKR